MAPLLGGARCDSAKTRMPAKLLNIKSFAGTRDHRCSPPHAPPGQFTRRRSQVRVLSRPPWMTRCCSRLYGSNLSTDSTRISRPMTTSSLAVAGTVQFLQEMPLKTRRRSWDGRCPRPPARHCFTMPFRRSMDSIRSNAFASPLADRESPETRPLKIGENARGVGGKHHPSPAR